MASSMENEMSDVNFKVSMELIEPLVAAVDLKIKSVERAQNTNKSPLFRDVYKAELRQYIALRNLLISNGG